MLTKASLLRTSWQEYCVSITDEQKDEIGETWLEDILGLSEEEISLLLQHNSAITTKVTILQSTMEKLKSLYIRNFWNKVNKIIPEIHSDADLDYLINSNNLWGLAAFILEIGPSPKCNSVVLNKIYSCMKR